MNEGITLYVDYHTLIVQKAKAWKFLLEETLFLRIEQGLCFGIGIASILAISAGKIKEFNQLVMTMHQVGNNLSNWKELYDTESANILGFMDIVNRVDMNQKNDLNFDYIIGPNRSYFAYTDSIIPLPESFSGVYTLTELIDVLNLIATMAINSNLNHPLSILFNQMNHVFVVSWDSKAMLWHVAGPNQLPIVSVKDSLIVAQMLEKEFSDAIFYAHFVVTRTDYEIINWHDLIKNLYENKKWKEIHSPTPYKMKQFTAKGADWLRVAICGDDFKAVESLIDAGQILNTTLNSSSSSPLHLAVVNKASPRLIEKLLKNKAFFKSIEECHDAWFYISLKHCFELAQLVLKYIPMKNFNFKNKFDFSVISYATLEKRIDLINLFINSHDVSYGLLNLKKSLFIAVEIGHKEVCELLLGYSDKINAGIELQRTNQMEIEEEALIDEENIEIKLLQKAVRYGHISLVLFFLEKFSINYEEKNDLLFIAARYGYKEIVSILLQQGASETVYELDTSSIKVACYKDEHTRITAEELIKSNTNSLNKTVTLTATDIATIMGHNQIVDLLHGYRHSLKSKNQAGNLTVYSIFSNKNVEPSVEKRLDDKFNLQ
ncbi:MAG TPA: ankyrin repeat domain-containing protein [Legionella sp.]|nr:ankyrin repeat domain-containing protein [Legionella sp.]